MRNRQLIGVVVLSLALSACASNQQQLERPAKNQDKAYIGTVERHAKNATSFVEVHWVNPPENQDGASYSNGN